MGATLAGRTRLRYPASGPIALKRGGMDDARTGMIALENRR
jgi:hypothetical protein